MGKKILFGIVAFLILVALLGNAGLAVLQFKEKLSPSAPVEAADSLVADAIKILGENDKLLADSQGKIADAISEVQTSFVAERVEASAAVSQTVGNIWAGLSQVAERLTVLEAGGGTSGSDTGKTGTDGTTDPGDTPNPFAGLDAGGKDPDSGKTVTVPTEKPDRATDSIEKITADGVSWWDENWYQVQMGDPSKLYIPPLKEFEEWLDSKDGIWDRLAALGYENPAEVPVYQFLSRLYDVAYAFTGTPDLDKAMEHAVKADSVGLEGVPSAVTMIAALQQAAGTEALAAADKGGKDGSAGDGNPGSNLTDPGCGDVENDWVATLCEATKHGIDAVQYAEHCTTPPFWPCIQACVGVPGQRDTSELTAILNDYGFPWTESDRAYIAQSFQCHWDWGNLAQAVEDWAQRFGKVAVLKERPDWQPAKPPAVSASTFLENYYLPSHVKYQNEIVAYKTPDNTWEEAGSLWYLAQQNSEDEERQRLYLTSILRDFAEANNITFDEDEAIGEILAIYQSCGDLHKSWVNWRFRLLGKEPPAELLCP